MTSPKDLKWDRKEYSRKPPISEQDKELMVDYLQAGLKMGKPRDHLLEELAEKWQRHPRQIERYIAQFSRRKEPSHEQWANEKEKLVGLVQKWREEIASYSAINLLQEWLDKAHENAIACYYTNEDVEMIYSKARERHAQPLQLEPFLQVENDPTFGLLRRRFPASDVWAAFHAWCERRIPYIQAFHQMLKTVECLAVGALDSAVAEFVKKGVEGVDWIDCINFPGFDKRCKLERLLTVFVTCDLLASGIGEIPSNPYWAHLSSDLETLRLRMNLELSEVTGIDPKGGWISGIMEIQAESPDRPLELTRGSLDELAELQSAEDLLVRALKKLENGI